MSDTTHTGFGGLLGQRTPMAGAATMVDETDDPEAALAAAGLDWTVSRRPLWFTGRGNGSKPVKVPGRFAVVRDDTEAMLGTVTAAYEPVQNAQAFEWARGLGTFVFGGSLRGGAQTYLGVRVREGVRAAGDEHDVYVVAWNGHDGKKSLGALLTPIRLACTNQMPTAHRTAVARFATRHTTGVVERGRDYGELLEVVDAEVRGLQQAADHAAAVIVDDGRATVMLDRVLPGRTRLQEGVLEARRTSPTIADEDRGNGWGLLSAITEFFEWGREAESRETALQTTLDGVGARAVRGLSELLAAAPA